MYCGFHPSSPKLPGQKRTMTDDKSQSMPIHISSHFEANDLIHLFIRHTPSAEYYVTGELKGIL